MANVIVAVLGGQPTRIEGVATVGDAKEQLGYESYTASVNGEPADDGASLDDEDFVSLAPSVKGGSR